MASPTQTVVGKGIPNSLIAEGLLKILMKLISPISPKSLSNSLPWNGRSTKVFFIFPAKWITDRTSHVKNHTSNSKTSIYPQQV